MKSKESLIRIVLLSLLLYSCLSFCAAGRELRRTQERLEALSAQLESLHLKNQKMQQKLDDPISASEAEQLARQRLGLVRPGEKIFYFTTDREGKPWNWQ